MNKNSKIYVAGHRGLVGSALMRRLDAGGYKNIITRKHSELDLTRQKDVEEFFEREKPEYVFLAAARVRGIKANSTYKADFIYVNMSIALNVISASQKYGVKKLLNLGSSCIYPKYAPQPMKEEYLLTGELESTNEPYAIAKISAIKLCRYYNEQYGTNYISVMPTNLYGPEDNFNLETSHVLPALLRRIYLGKLLMEGNLNNIRKDFDFNEKTDKYAKMSDKELESHLNKHLIYKDKVVIWGTGEPYREFLFSDDLADACVFLMEKHDAQNLSEFINIGTGRDLKIKELSQLIKKITGYKGSLEFDPSKPDGTPKKQLDVSRLNALGWRESVTLEEGIAKVFSGFSKHY